MYRRTLHLAFWVSALGSTICTATAMACSGCTDFNLDFSYPFVMWWFKLMLVWALLRGAAEGGLACRAAVGIAVFFAVGWLSWGSLMVPAQLFTMVWVVEVMVRVYERKSRPMARWWLTVNRLCLVFIVGSLVYAQCILTPSPDRLARYARRTYPSACRRAADRLVALGYRAVPAIARRMVAPEAGCHEDTRVRGVRLAEQATGLDFDGSPDAFLAWWADQQQHVTPAASWLPPLDSHAREQAIADHLARGHSPEDLAGD